MKRHYWQFLIDSAGNCIEGANIHVFLAGTNDYAWIFKEENGTPITTELDPIVSDSKGFFDFWIANDTDDPTYGYSTKQRFDITYNKTGYTTGTIKNVDILFGGGEGGGKVKLNASDSLDYLPNKLIAGENVTVEVSGSQMVVSGQPSSSTKIFTTSVNVNGLTTTTFNLSNFANRILIYKISISVNGITTNYDFKIYEKDTFLSTDLLYELISVSPTTIFIDRLPFFYCDLDLTNELHLLITNADSNTGTFNIEVIGEKFA